MRVIAGKCRSLPLQAPAGTDTRPTTDRIKETLFNILMPFIPGARFLDVFAGSGGIGIEALSRGASSVVLVEKSGYAASVIKGNLNKLHLSEDDDIRLMKSGYDAALNALADEGRKFDVIFMDPPYRMAHKAAVTAAAEWATRSCWIRTTRTAWPWDLESRLRR